MKNQDEKKEVVKKSRGSNAQKNNAVVEPPESSELKNDKDYTHIPGWGMDADKENDPTYPMRKRENETHKGYSEAVRPLQQPVDIEVLHSNERPNVSAVFGTDAPPRGLSGMLRRFAFRYSESNLGHWLPLVAADRVDVIEGVIDDLAHGHIPNLWKEYGLASEWKYNKKSFLTKVAIGTAVISATVGVALILSDKKLRKKIF